MTVAVEPDVRGVQGLSGEVGPGVELPCLIWDGIVAEFGSVPDVPVVDPFDGGPWRELPSVEELSHLWLESPFMEILHNIALVAHGDGEDLPQFMAQQWRLAEFELQLIKGRGVRDAAGVEGVVDRAVGGDGAVGVAATRRGGGDVSGGSEDSDAVGVAQEAAVDPYAGRPSKVSGKRRPGKAA